LIRGYHRKTKAGSSNTHDTYAARQGAFPLAQANRRESALLRFTSQQTTTHCESPTRRTRRPGPRRLRPLPRQSPCSPARATPAPPWFRVRCAQASMARLRRHPRASMTPATLQIRSGRGRGTERKQRDSHREALAVLPSPTLLPRSRSPAPVSSRTARQNRIACK
jgi:hypothetical protein